MWGLASVWLEAELHRELLTLSGNCPHLQTRRCPIALKRVSVVLLRASTALCFCIFGPSTIPPLDILHPQRREMASNGEAGGLSNEQIAFWDKNGYLIIPNALDGETVQSLLQDTRKMLHEFSLDDHPMTKFSTGGDDGRKHVGDDYFLESGDKVRFFFEEGESSVYACLLSEGNSLIGCNSSTRVTDAFSPSGDLTKPKHLAINKIGHYLHELHPGYRSISLSRQNALIARSLRFRDPRVLQSMVICKQPEIGGAVPPHQDSTFLYTDPPSAVGFWYALEDATAENGCLSFLEGSHRRAAIENRFVRVDGGKGGTGFEENTGGKFPSGIDAAAKDGERGEEGEYKMGPVKAGSLVLIHGNILHKSERNLSGKSRYIYTFHVIEGDLPYDGRNWLQPPKGGFSKLNP